MQKRSIWRSYVRGDDDQEGGIKAAQSRHPYVRWDDAE